MIDAGIPLVFQKPTPCCPRMSRGDGVVECSKPPGVFPTQHVADRIGAIRSMAVTQQLANGDIASPRGAMQGRDARCRYTSHVLVTRVHLADGQVVCAAVKE
jgi:hypothetical protein